MASPFPAMMMRKGREAQWVREGVGVAEVEKKLIQRGGGGHTFTGRDE